MCVEQIEWINSLVRMWAQYLLYMRIALFSLFCPTESVMNLDQHVCGRRSDASFRLYAERVSKTMEMAQSPY